MREITTKHEGELLAVRVLRADANNVEQTLTVTVKPRRAPGAGRVVIGLLPMLDARHAVVAKTIATETLRRPGYPPRARIVSVNQKPVSSFFDVIAEVRRWQGQPVTLQYRLDEQAEGGVTLPAGRDGKPVSVASVLAEPVPFKQLDRLYQAQGSGHAIAMGYRRTARSSRRPTSRWPACSTA